MAGQRLRFGLSILAMLGSTLFLYAGPLVIKGAIDYLISGQAIPPATRQVIGWLGGQDRLAHHLWAAAAAMVVVTLLSGLLGYVSSKLSAQATESIAMRLRNRLYDHIQHLPISYFDRCPSGDLLQRSTSDVETFRSFLSGQIVEVGRALILLVTALPILLMLDVRMTLISMAVIPVVIASAVFFFMRIQHAFRASDEAESRMTTLLQENLSGARVVRAFARTDYEIAKFAQGNDQYRDRWYRLLALLSVYWSSSDFLCIGQTGAVLVAGAYYVAIGSITVGTLYAFTAYVGLFLWPARNMGRVLAELGKAMVAVGRIHEILEEPAESEPAEAVAVPQPQGHLVVRSLGFNHGQQAVLQDVCLDVPAGSTLGLLGPAGSGKSTLINLLLRLYDYDQGSITLDRVELRQLPRSLVRQRVGSVLQEPFLYSRTLRENIKLAHSHAGDPEMFEAAASADIHDSILTFESGYDTVVGERGVTLSGGQRQRVAIARALLRNPPVLILDDAMSAVDTQTEGVILRALRRRHGKMTTIVIAHRLTTLMHADMIAVLEGGRVTQSGSHQQLLREDGLYKRLWHVQTSMQRDLQQDLLTGGPLADAARRT